MTNGGGGAMNEHDRVYIAPTQLHSNPMHCRLCTLKTFKFKQIYYNIISTQKCKFSTSFNRNSIKLPTNGDAWRRFNHSTRSEILNMISIHPHSPLLVYQIECGKCINILRFLVVLQLPSTKSSLSEHCSWAHNVIGPHHTIGLQ